MNDVELDTSFTEKMPIVVTLVTLYIPEIRFNIDCGATGLMNNWDVGVRPRTVAHCGLSALERYRYAISNYLTLSIFSFVENLVNDKGHRRNTYLLIVIHYHFDQSLGNQTKNCRHNNYRINPIVSMTIFVLSPSSCSAISVKF